MSTRHQDSQEDHCLEYCGRIMIDPELAGVKTDKPASDEKPIAKQLIRKTTKKAEEEDNTRRSIICFFYIPYGQH